MNDARLAFVQVQPTAEGSRASILVSDLLDTGRDPELLLKRVAETYDRHVRELRAVYAEIDGLRRERRPVPARRVWQFGDAVFKLRDDLAELRVQLDDLYAHLTRDVGPKRKWLEKAVILRRYVNAEDIIPPSLNWGRCKDGTKRIAEQLTADHRTAER